MDQVTVSYLITGGAIASLLVPALQAIFKRDSRGYPKITRLGWALFIVSAYLWIVNILENKAKTNAEQAAAKQRQEDREMFQSEIRSLKIIIDSLSVDPAERDSVGLGLSGILTIGDIPDRRRKFLFDIGQSTEHDRMSLYLDFDNNLVFRVIDSHGETYSLRVVENFITFKQGAKYFIYCDVGSSKNYSFLRLYLDDRRIGIQEFNSKIDIAPINTMKRATMGADIDGNNAGKYTISMWGFYNNPLKKKELNQIMNRQIKLLEDLHADK